MLRALVIGWLTLLTASPASTPQAAPKDPSPVHVFAVWDASCIKAVGMTDKTQIVAPVNDEGEPQMDQAKIMNVTADYVPGCGHFEVRK